MKYNLLIDILTSFRAYFATAVKLTITHLESHRHEDWRTQLGPMILGPYMNHGPYDRLSYLAQVLSADIKGYF